MKKSLLAACALAVLLTACALDPRAYREFGVRTASNAFASVQVVADRFIVVSQEPIYVQQDEDNAIYWSLPQGGAYWFGPKGSHKPGIVFENPQMPQTDCDYFKGDKYTYVCTYKKANKKKYPYAIHVTKDGTNFLDSDPTAMNN